MAPASAWLIETYQWRAAYMLTGILAWILIIPGAMILKKDSAEIGIGLDGDPYFRTGSRDEAKKITPFSIIDAIKSANFSYLIFVWFWFSFCLYMVITHIVPRAQDIGIDPMRAAGVMSIMMAVSAASRVAGGMAADKVDKRKLLAASLTIMAFSMAWLILADQSWKIYLFAILFGMVFGSGDTSLIAVVADVFGTDKIGTMMGILMISCDCVTELKYQAKRYCSHNIGKSFKAVKVHFRSTLFVNLRCLECVEYIGYCLVRRDQSYF